MTNRKFVIEADETVTVRKTVTYHVYADNFEDARERFYDGYADHYDSYEYDECTDDQEINEILCYECDCDSEDCECGRPASVDPSDNPDHAAEGVHHIHDFTDEDVFMPADQYTRDKMSSYINRSWLDVPLTLVYAADSEVDDDGDYRLVVIHPEHGRESCYVDDACRFVFASSDSGDLTPGQQALVARIEAEKAEVKKKRDEYNALDLLLNV